MEWMRLQEFWFLRDVVKNEGVRFIAPIAFSKSGDSPLCAISDRSVERH